MYKSERTLREERYAQGKQNPSFSSTLLDKIYRSIDESDPKGEDLKFYSDAAMARKQSIRDMKKCGSKSNRCTEETLTLHPKVFVNNKVGDDEGVKMRQVRDEFERKQRRDRDRDHDALFFSSTSSSSDSSSGGFSSSDTESMYGVVKTRSSCFAPPPLPRPKPVRTSSSAKPEKTERTLLQEQKKKSRDFDHYSHGSSAEQSAYNEEGMIKSKSRALRIYSNLKKVKQPISPGGRLSNFINSLFSATNSKKPKSTPVVGGYVGPTAERKSQSAQESVCSSASSFSRSCLSKQSPATRQKLHNGVKRTVRFYPVSVIVDEDCRPCGHKSLYAEDHEEYDPNSMPVSVPSAWKIGGRPPPSRRTQETEEVKCHVIEKSRRVEEAAREFLRDYYQNQKKVRNDTFGVRGHREINRVGDDENEGGGGDDDDTASYSSSDLFELDHLAVIGNERYCEELPVYETTHVGTNRAIANGLIM